LSFHDFLLRDNLGPLQFILGLLGMLLRDLLLLIPNPDRIES